MKDGSLLMLVSLLVAPYAWFTDQALAIPALLAGAYLTCSRSLIAALALASAAIEIELLSSVSMHSALYLWAAPAWIIWYLCAVRKLGSSGIADPENKNRDQIAALS